MSGQGWEGRDACWGGRFHSLFRWCPARRVKESIERLYYLTFRFENFLNFCYLAAYDPYSGEWHQKVAIVRGQVDGQPAGRCQAGPGVCVSDAELRDAGLEADPSDHGQRLVHLDYR